MAAGKKQKKERERHVKRKSHQIIAKLRDSNERMDFERRLRAKCKEVNIAVPPFLSHGTGESVTVVCKNRDQAFFVLDFAEEALAELPE